jgi:hypothetical protein
MQFVCKRVSAARKAVNTLRLNLLAKVDSGEVIRLSNEIIQKQYDIDEDYSRQSIIARELNKTTWKSFCRFGSKRNATPALILCWIDNGAMSLDEQAMWMTENYGMEIQPDELAEFMMIYDRGKSGYESYQELSVLKLAFKQLTGFNFDIKFVRQHILKPQHSTEDYPF